GELRPGHVDAVAERAAHVVVDGHELLVEQEVTGAGYVVVLGHGTAGEVERRAVGAGGPVHEQRAGLVRVGRHGGAAQERLAGQVRVAPGVPGDRGVTAGLPVLARLAEGGCSAAEPVGSRGVGPGPATVERVGDAAGAVTAAVVV